MTGFRHIRAVAFDLGGTLMQEHFHQTRSLRTLPFAEAALEALAPHALLVVATNSNYSAEHTAALLDRMHIRPYFQHIFTSQTTDSMKPLAPYFRFMLQTLALQPHEVVMVGDSYFHDIEGAKWQGLWTVWLSDSQTDAADADVVISGMRGLPPAVAWLDQRATEAADSANRPALP